MIESELYICIHDCMKTFYKGIHVTGMHRLDLQLLQDKINSLDRSKKNCDILRYEFRIAIRISYCDTI